MASKNKKTGIIVFIIIVVLAIGSAAFQIFFNKNEGFKSISPDDFNFSSRSSSSKGDVVAKGSSKHKKDYVAEIIISGTIQEANNTYNQAWLLDTISDLTEDDHNKGIILYIDSPGGTVYEADEAYLALEDYRSTGKPIYAYFGSLAASGGYYIACAADYIMANRNTLTGSIGVISGNFVDLTGLFEKYGIKYTTITAGKNKNMGNYNQPMTEEQRAIMQSIADECYEQFTQIVAGSRNMDIKDVQKLADGRVYTAKQALNNGLIDGIGNFDSIVNYMDATEFDGEDYNIVKYEYIAKQTFYSKLISMMSAVTKSKAESSNPLPQIVEKALENDVPYPAYFYSSGRF